MSNEILATIMGALTGLLGLIPPLLTFIYGRKEKRGIFSAKKREIELAQNRVAFLNTWIETKKLVCTEEELQETKQLMEKELTLLFTNLSKTLSELELVVKPLGRNWFRKLFLIYRPHMASGWLFHILFYLFLGLSSFTLIGLGASGEYFMGIDPDTGKYDFAFQIGEILGGCMILLLPWVLFWWIARILDRTN